MSTIRETIRYGKEKLRSISPEAYQDFEKAVKLLEQARREADAGRCEEAYRLYQEAISLIQRHGEVFRKVAEDRIAELGLGMLLDALEESFWDSYFTTCEDV